MKNHFFYCYSSYNRKEGIMKKLAAVMLCVGLCIAIGVLYPQVGTSTPGVDPDGCLASGCHNGLPGEGLHSTHSEFGCDVCHNTAGGGGPVQVEDCLACHLDEGEDLCDLVDGHGAEAGCLECHEICEEPPIPPGDCEIDVIAESLPKSQWTPLPAVFRIETIGILDLNLLTPVNIVCGGDGGLFPSITKTGKVVLPNFGTNTKVILQTGIIWPGILTDSRDLLDSETCVVSVGGCVAIDTFQLRTFCVPLGN
jgi:hypothetical protein